MRKVELKKRAGASVKMTRIHRKVEQREERREKKALVAANIEKSIQTELVERLARGAYGDIYNFPEVSYQKALDDAANKNDDEENDGEYEIENEIESVLDEDDSQMIEYVEDFSDDEEVEDDEEDISETEEYSNASGEDESSILGDDNDKGDVENSLGSHERQRNSNKRKGSKKPELKRKRGARLEIEYEEEDEEDATEVTQRMESVAGMAW